MTRFGLALACCLWPAVAPAQDVEKLIDRLTEIDGESVDDSLTWADSSFLPVSPGEAGVALLFGPGHVPSEAMTELVRLGPKAVSALLKHLSDARPTKLELRHDAPIGSLVVWQDPDGAAKDGPPAPVTRHYTVLVGDLCYVALGQIVNRDYWAVRYAPTLSIQANSVPYSRKLREDIVKEWGGLTLERHRDALVKGFPAGDASVRLAYYYPETLERLALKELSRQAKIGPIDASFIEGLRYDSSEKLDRAVRNVLAGTNDNDTARACFDRLVGRGYDAEIAAYLKRHTPDADDGFREPLLAYENKLGWTRLHAAVELGVPEMLDAAFQFKAPIDARRRDGRTALHMAAATGRSAMVEMLLKAKADREVRDRKGRSAVQLAAHEDHPAIVRRLLASDGDAPDVFVAAIVGDSRRLAAFLKVVPALVNSRNRHGLTPLHVAVREGRAGAVEALIAGKADVDAGDGDPGNESVPGEGRRPLHFAASGGGPAVAKDLLAAGANPEVVEWTDGRTPLHLAAWHGNIEVVKVLLAGKADRKATDQRDRTPLMLAEERGHAAIMTVLLK